MSLEVVTFSVSEVRLAAFLGVDAMRTVPDLTLEPAGVLSHVALDIWIVGVKPPVGCHPLHDAETNEDVTPTCNC